MTKYGQVRVISLHIMTIIQNNTKKYAKYLSKLFKICPEWSSLLELELLEKHRDLVQNSSAPPNMLAVSTSWMSRGPKKKNTNSKFGKITCNIHKYHMITFTTFTTQPLRTFSKLQPSQMSQTRKTLLNAHNAAIRTGLCRCTIDLCTCRCQLSAVSNLQTFESMPLSGDSWAASVWGPGQSSSVTVTTLPETKRCVRSETFLPLGDLNSTNSLNCQEILLTRDSWR